MAISDYNSTPGLNTAISGINVAEGCAPGNVNDAIRQMMADLKTYDATTLPAAYQAKDADLTAIAGLTSAADRVPYYTGAGTAALATFTSAGRALVDDVDAAAQRTTLGLVIGTNVQAYDAALASLAGLSLVAGDIIYATGADTFVRLAKGTATQLLRMNAGATAPEWATVTFTPSTSDVLTATAGLTVGDVGSYAFLQFATPTLAAAGSTHAGSGLRYANADGGSTSGTPAGTWRLLGNTNSTGAAISTSLFVRTV